MKVIVDDKLYDTQKGDMVTVEICDELRIAANHDDVKVLTLGKRFETFEDADEHSKNVKTILNEG